MTAHALVEERQRCLDAGMNDHVSKPIDPDALFSTLLRWAKPRPKQTTDRQAPPAKADDEVTLPEIAGINVADGVKRVAGNKRLYRDLLTQFAAKQSDTAAEISASITNGDLKLAERIAHTVKGVAGNIGITEVQSAAQRLEKAIREGPDSVSLAAPRVRSIVEHSSRCYSASAARGSTHHTTGDAHVAFQWRSGIGCDHTAPNLA